MQGKSGFMGSKRKPPYDAEFREGAVRIVVETGRSAGEVTEELGINPVALLCKVMKTARSTYYAWVAGAEAREARRRADEALAHEITVIHLASRRNCGVPRVTAEPRRQDRPVASLRSALLRDAVLRGRARPFPPPLRRRTDTHRPWGPPPAPGRGSLLAAAA